MSATGLTSITMDGKVPKPERRYSMATNYPINPRVRAYGKARLDLARRAHNGEDWKRIWNAPHASLSISPRWRLEAVHRVQSR